MRTLMILAALAAVSGCSVIGQPVAAKVADAVEVYCNEPLSSRQVVRHTVNNEVGRSGHRVLVICSGDPE